MERDKTLQLNDVNMKHPAYDSEPRMLLVNEIIKRLRTGELTESEQALFFVYGVLGSNSFRH